jgi:hypothetical protein
VFTTVASPHTIQVAQRAALRTELAANVALRILVPILAALLLFGVFQIDIETCSVCGRGMRIIACIEDPASLSYG